MAKAFRAKSVYGRNSKQLVFALKQHPNHQPKPRPKTFFRINPLCRVERGRGN